MAVLPLAAIANGELTFLKNTMPIGFRALSAPEGVIDLAFEPKPSQDRGESP